VIVAGVILLVIFAGFFLLRNQLFAAEQPTATPVPTAIPTNTPTEIPTLTAVPATLPPTEAETVTASVIPFAPACDAGITIPVPVVKEINKVCTKKIPYTFITIPEGATFESLNPAMTCARETTNNGNTIISCKGQQVFSYQLRVCTPPVLSSDDLGKCSPDSTYNSANQCCAAVSQQEAGCTEFKVDLRSCP